MVWSADLQAKIEAETEGVKFYRPDPIAPHIERKVLDSWFGIELTAYLTERKAYQDQEGFMLTKLTPEDFKYLECQAYIDGKMLPEKFKYAKKEDFEVIGPANIQLSTLKLKVPFNELTKENLNEIVSEISICANANNNVHNYEITPFDAASDNYFRLAVSPNGKIHAYPGVKEYTIKKLKLLKWCEYAVIELPSGRTLRDWTTIEKFTK